MKVLGIDPGTRSVGYALLSNSTNSKKIEYLKSGTIVLGNGELLNRLLDLQIKINELIKTLKPDQIAFESLIYVKSPTSLIKLAMAKGVMLGVIGTEFKDKIFEYKPNVVKQVVTGHGHADKISIQKMIGFYLNKKSFKSHDESDAISIAMCHLFLKNNISKISTGKRGFGSLANAIAHKVDV